MEDPLKAPEHPTCAAIVNCLGDVDDCEKRAFGLSSDRQKDCEFTSSTNEGQWTPYAWSSGSSAESSKFSIEDATQVLDFKLSHGTLGSRRWP